MYNVCALCCSIENYGGENEAEAKRKKTETTSAAVVAAINKPTNIESSHNSSIQFTKWKA